MAELLLRAASRDALKTRPQGVSELKLRPVKTSGSIGETMGHMAPDEVRKIVGGNAAKLYGLDLSKATVRAQLPIGETSALGNARRFCPEPQGHRESASLPAI